MGCGMTTVKISYIICNILLAIICIGLIVFAIINRDDIEKEGALPVCIVCVLVLIFAFLGGFAAIRESICLTATCATFVLLLAVLQITIACYYLTSYNPGNGSDTVNLAWQNDAMASIEIEHECCGKTSAQDYVHISKPIPLSCYQDQQFTQSESFYPEGCSAKLQDYYDSERVAFLVGSSFLIILEVITFLLALFLVINFRNKQRRLQF